MTDGTASTIAVVEVAGNQAVPWMSPKMAEILRFRADRPVEFRFIVSGRARQIALALQVSGWTAPERPQVNKRDRLGTGRYTTVDAASAFRWRNEW